MDVLVQPDERGMEQSPALEVERTPRLGEGQVSRLRLAPADRQRSEVEERDG